MTLLKTGANKEERSGISDSELIMVAKELARAYVPFQKYSRRFGSEEALKMGTLFPELYQPYHPREKRK